MKSKSSALFFLFLGFILFSFTDKTPNYAWMSTYSGPSFPSLQTGISIFRLWVPIEHLEYSLLGEVWYSENLIYGLCGGCLLYLMANEGNQKNNIILMTICTIASIIAIFFSSWGGSICDILFSLALILAIKKISLLTVKSSIKYQIFIVTLLTLLDMTRPYGIFYVALLLLFTHYKTIKFKENKIKISRAFLFIFITTLCTTLPFHVIQYKRFGSLTLSTYGGNNLMESLQSVATINDALDCKAILGRGGLDSAEAMECANTNKDRVIEHYLSDKTLLMKVFSPTRIKNVFLFPEIYWHATKIKENLSFKILKDFFYFLLSVIYILTFFSYRNNLESLVTLIAYTMGIFLISLGHNGQEALRVYLPFLILLIYNTSRNFNTVYLMKIIKFINQKST
jgi:hypothetical protein